MARVLFTTTPGRGHFQPMLPLAYAFRARGHELRWAAAAEVCERLRRDGFEAVEAGLAEGSTSASIDTRFPEIMSLPPAERPNLLFSKLFGPARAGPMLDALLPVIRDWKPALVVSEQAELAGPLAAAIAGVACVTHSFGRLLPRARVARAGEEMASLWEAHDLEPRPFAGTYDHLYLDIYPPSLQTPETDHVGAIQPLRPVAPPAPEAEPVPGAVDPAAAEPLVYVTFGTVFNRNLALIASVVEALRELPLRVVVTLGPGHDTDALGDQPANVHVTDFIPQAQLLPHCAAVVSHGGSGTFLAALAAGLPQLVLPQAADQFLNAEAAAGGGVAIAIPPDEISTEGVRAAAERVLSDAAMRAAAERTGEEIAAMPSPETVLDVIEQRFEVRGCGPWAASSTSTSPPSSTRTSTRSGSRPPRSG